MPKMKLTASRPMETAIHTGFTSKKFGENMDRIFGEKPLNNQEDAEIKFCKTHHVFITQDPGREGERVRVAAVTTLTNRVALPINNQEAENHGTIPTRRCRHRNKKG